MSGKRRRVAQRGVLPVPGLAALPATCSLRADAVGAALAQLASTGADITAAAAGGRRKT